MCREILASTNSDFSEAPGGGLVFGSDLYDQEHYAFQRDVHTEMQTVSQAGGDALAGETWVGIDGRINMQFYPKCSNAMTAAGNLAPWPASVN